MTQVHSMKLNDVPFDATKAGFKTIEVRLNDERRRNIQAGDILEFHRITDGETMRAIVLEVRSYKSLQDLTQKEDFSKTGGIYQDHQDWISAIDNYYSQEDQTRYGLLSIEIKL